MYRKAATLILSIPKSLPKSLFNYEVLTMKRTAKASFMPNSNFFPGGALSAADSDEKWLTQYGKSEILLLTPTNPKAPRPPMMSDDNSR
mgnify:CR=1 FL=1